MTQVWHIAKKDLRRLAIPLGAWLVLILVPTLVFWLMSPVIEGHIASSIAGSMGVAAIWTRLLFILQLVFGYLLAGSFVLEDPLVGTNAFWTTRPIARRTLLGAKLLVGALSFVVLPVALLAGVWFAHGFSFREACLAAMEFAKWQGTLTLIAVTAASLVGGLPQFLLLTIPLFGADLMSTVVAAPLFQDASVPVRVSRAFLAREGFLPILAFIAVQQFLTRRRGRAWATFAVAFVVGIVIRVAWPWDISSLIPAERSAVRLVTRPEDRIADITTGPALVQFRPNAAPFLSVTAPWTGERTYVPAFARFSDGTIARGAVGPGENEAGLRALGLAKGAEPLSWQILLFPPLADPKTETARLSGTLEIWAVRPRVLGELPLRAGARLVSGAERTRIIALGRHEDRLDEIYVEERDSASDARGAWVRNGALTDLKQFRYLDQYFLVNANTRQAKWAPASDLESLAMNSLFVRYRRLQVTVPSDWTDARLVKLRFEADYRFDRPFEVRGVEPWKSEGRP